MAGSTRPARRACESHGASPGSEDLRPPAKRQRHVHFESEDDEPENPEDEDYEDYEDDEDDDDYYQDDDFEDCEDEGADRDGFQLADREEPQVGGHIDVSDAR